MGSRFLTFQTTKSQNHTYGIWSEENQTLPITKNYLSLIFLNAQALSLVFYLKCIRHGIFLFNYKNNGTDSGKILIGLQVPEDEQRLLEKFLKQLGYEYTNESKNLAYKLFLNKKS